MNKLEKILGIATVAGMCFIPKVFAQPGPINPAELPFEPKGVIAQAAVGDSVFVYNKKDDNLVGATATSYDDTLKVDGFYDVVIPTDMAATPEVEGPLAGDELYFKLKKNLDGVLYALNSINGAIIHSPGQIEEHNFDIGADVHEERLSAFNLSQNFPNPFNPSTTIEYKVGKEGHIRVDVYNIAGQKVRTLVNDSMEPGTYSTVFDGTGLSSGQYFVSMETGNYTSTKKMMLVK